MEQEIKIFEHEQFGQIRVIIIEGEPWFVGKDVAKALGYANSRKALADHVDEEDKKDGVTIRDSIGREQTPTLINESGFYSMVLLSKMPKAIEFKRWVTKEVLPSIRKTGSYSIVQPTPAPVVAKPVHVPNPNRVAGQHKNACLYVSAVSNGTVKFGQSCNVKARKANIQSVHKVKLGEPHTTSDFPRKVACLAEQACKDIFAPYRVEGEFFRVDNDLACRVVDALDKLITALPSALELEFANKLLEVVKIVSNTPEGKALLHKAENIIVDKKLV